MKFVHIADMHFDTVFNTLSGKQELCKLRRIEQRNILRKVINYIKENQIQYLFISGDLYEHKYIKESTIKYINDLFKSIPETRIFISPGNHDPYLKNSFYYNFMWNENVHIFTPELEKLELDDINIYGYGFGDFYEGRINLNKICLNEKEKLNILVIHGTLDGSELAENNYNPISKRELEQIGFDYVALGHIHKTNYNDSSNQKIIYPGSTISLGFDEQGNHGMIVGEISKNNIKTEFIKLDESSFEVKEINVSEVYSEEELISIINNLSVPENVYLKVVLIGERKFEINITEINKLNQNNNIIRIKNETKIGCDINKLIHETTLKGLFAKEILNEIKNNPMQEEFYNDVLEIGLEILDK